MHFDEKRLSNEFFCFLSKKFLYNQRKDVLSVLDKRIIAVFAAFCMTVGCLCLRLYVLSSSGTELVSSEPHYSSFTLGNIRGQILDCKGRKITDSDYENRIVAKPTIKSLDTLRELLDSRTYTSIKKRMENGSPITVNINKQRTASNGDILCVPIYKRYSSAQPAVHILGYLDEEYHGVTGIEKAFDNILYSDESITARVPVDAYGRSLNGAKIELNYGSPNVGEVRLTVDLDIQKTVENALDKCGINEGCAIVADVKSGAIKAIASRPAYDPYRISDYLGSESSPLLNRSLESFAVGSIFKVAVAACAIENGVSDFKYTCNGSCKIGDVTFGCSSNTSHGKVDLQKALEKSCNTYFINLGQKLGSKKLSETASLLGFGQGNVLCDGIEAESGVLPSADDLINPAALANFSFGQGNFTATPIQIVEMLCAVGNGGKYSRPYLVDTVKDRSGKAEKHTDKYPTVAMSEETSELLLKMLTSVVENGNASPAKPESFSAAGKTATAQTGIFDRNGNEICNTWFGGIFPSDNPRYVAVIMKQGGSSGSYDCAPVFKMIADGINFSE